MNKRSTIIYWSVTLLFALLMVFGGATELIGPKQAVANILQLGYPRYLLAFLGIAKLLGVTAILVGRYPRLKEWAYAGFTFDLLGAAYSHLSIGQTQAAMAPIVCGIIGAASYILWRMQDSRESRGAVVQDPRSHMAAVGTR